MSPKQRSLAYMKKLGFLCGDVERRIPGEFITIDFMGFADFIAINDDETIAVQVCGGSGDPAKHIKKCTTDPKVVPKLTRWLMSLSRSFQIQGWRKVGPRGKRKLWKPRIIQIELDLDRNLQCRVVDTSTPTFEEDDPDE
jgi:tRNA 2-selenouridine synthase SelU